MLASYDIQTNLRKFVLTTVILPPGVENPGSVWPAVMRFSWIGWIGWIRWRIPGGLKKSNCPMVVAHLAGKWGPILTPTLKKTCKLGPEPQSTQHDPKSSPNGSPKMVSRPPYRDFTQIFCEDPARGAHPLNLNCF